ncbi:inactive protein RESTRICTED TEV MOVEMENT 2-like [Miscanthus floridulus]|uniref:inactive protein RESTRICTED TEV MOVEMENT 2-like n=1 Tax=Miscanthus floridulus TaxID=154761 RepID=UPI003458C70D
MDRRRSAAAARVFEDFEPAVEWKLAGEEQDVVEISLPGFRKDQVRVQMDNHGVLHATGERPTRGDRWARFKKDLRLPENCNADGVRARFEGEKLIITLPIVVATTPSPPPSHSPTPSPPEPSWPPAYSEPTIPRLQPPPPLLVQRSPTQVS